MADGAAYVQAKGWDETSIIPLSKPSATLLETGLLSSPLHVHCPNHAAGGIKGNYNVSFAPRLQGLAWESNAITG